MFRSFALVLSLATAGLIAWAASRTPEPIPAAAPPGVFSAGRAMADVRAIAARPHPLGSAEHDRVRDYLVDRFKALGLETEVWNGHAIEVEPDGSIQGGDVSDVVAVLPGWSRTAPAVAVMAHYDTVAASPGAADDSVGVAAALETARALKAAPLRARDVVFLITDGEEEGLLGARAFFADHPLARRIGAALNMEARGGGGRAYMFETGARDGAMIDLFRRTAANPTANSMASFVYAQMPNDTDFTVAKAKGIAGFNYAFIGLPFDYHAASSTVSNLDQGSLQHIGGQVLAAARALAEAPGLPPKAADVVYFDLLGGPVIAYPTWAGWLALALAAGIGGAAFRRAFRDEPFAWFSAFRGAAALALATALSGGLLWLARWGTDVPAGFFAARPLLARFDLYEIALAAACLASAGLSFAVLGLGRPRAWSAYAGASAVGLALAIALQAAAPLAAFLIAGPILVAAGVAAALAFRWHGAVERRSALVFTALASAPVLAELIYIAHPVVLGVGADLPEILAAFVLLASLLPFPVLWRQPPWLGAAALVIGAALVLVIRVADPWSPRHPRPTQALFVADLDDSRFWRLSSLPDLDDWTRDALKADDGTIRRGSLPPLAEPAWLAPARPIETARPRVDISQGADGRIVVQLVPAGPARRLRMVLTAAATVRGLTANGVAVPVSAKPGEAIDIAWSAPRDGLSVSFARSGPGKIDVRYAVTLDGWPDAAPPLPPRPANTMPWGTTDTTVLIGAAARP